MKNKFLPYFLVVSFTLSAASFALAESTNNSNQTPDKKVNGDDSNKNRIELLEARQLLLVESGRADLERMYFLFSAVSAFFAVIAVFATIRSIVNDKRQNKLEERHLQQFGQMMTSFGDNVSKANEFISSLTGTLKVQQELAKKYDSLDDGLKQINDARKQEENTFRSQVDKLNSDFADNFRTCGINKKDRGSFKKEENRIALKTLASRMNTLLVSGNADELFSPVAYFLRALSCFNEMDYKGAQENIRVARKLSKQQQTYPLAQYGAWTNEERDKNLGILLDESHYHLGIIYYNTGEWELAREEFGVAYERHELDFRSRIYIPELMFFDNSSNPQHAEREFLSVATELKNIPKDKRNQMTTSWSECVSMLKMRHANMYLKKLFEPTSRNQIWRSIQGSDGNKKAIAYYWEAREKHKSPFVDFSLAQAMTYDNLPAKEGVRSKDLFKACFYSFRDQAIVKTEPIQLSLLNYCAAICCQYADDVDENPSSYLNLARQHLQRIPSSIYVFSPVCKQMIRNDDLCSEMNQVEQHWKR